MTAKATHRPRRLTIFQQASSEHELMAEYITTALQTQTLFDAPHPIKKVKAMQRFLNDRVVRHFRFEEEEVFPQLAATGSAATRRAIKRLISEHKTMLSLVASLQRKMSKMTAASSEKAWRTLQASFGDLLRMLLTHTMTEDYLYQTAMA